MGKSELHPLLRVASVISSSKIVWKCWAGFILQVLDPLSEKKKAKWLGAVGWKWTCRPRHHPARAHSRPVADTSSI